MRNYLKLFKEINRKIYLIQMVSVRLACKSRINEQKALWRLMINAKKAEKKEIEIGRFLKR